MLPQCAESLRGVGQLIPRHVSVPCAGHDRTEKLFKDTGHLEGGVREGIGGGDGVVEEMVEDL
jgi:hypothetical protein